MSLRLPARGLLFAAACAGALACAAQTAPPGQPNPAAPNPLDAKAMVPALNYESAFARFRRWSDDKPIAWRQANDTVSGIGGWRVYAREAQQADRAPADKATVAAPANKEAPAAAPTDKGAAAAPVDKAAAAAPVSAPAPASADPAKPVPAGHAGHIAP